jgi:hypothetical protein
MLRIILETKNIAIAEFCDDMNDIMCSQHSAGKSGIVVISFALEIIFAFLVRLCSRSSRFLLVPIAI